MHRLYEQLSITLLPLFVCWTYVPNLRGTCRERVYLSFPCDSLVDTNILHSGHIIRNVLYIDLCPHSSLEVLYKYILDSILD